MHWRLFFEAISLDNQEGQGNKTLSTCTQNVTASPKHHALSVIISPERESQFGKALQSYWPLYPKVLKTYRFWENVL